LDGGHILYVLLGKRMRAIFPYILAVLVAMGFVWSGWWLWAALLFMLGRVYAEPLDQITPLDPRRKMLAIFAMIILVLVFTPVPLIQFG
jgi:membrane-associated protease RseP (regulator of RpoE activity)